MDNLIFEKVITNNATEEEKEEFFLKIESDEELRSEYIRYKYLLAISSINDHPVSENTKKEFFSELWSRTGSRGNKARMNTIFLIVSKYAAILLIAVSVVYFSNEYFRLAPEKTSVKKYSTSKGSIATIMLSDSSEIWLNANSSLIINEKKKGEIVARLDGEAYFEIRHDNKRRFIVDLGKIQVKDMGTSFNIRSYENEDQVTATLIEGAVDVHYKEGGKMISMVPTDHFRFNKSENKYELSHIDPGLATGWKEGKFVFLNLTLREICNELEKWYNVKITIESERYGNATYTSVINRSTSIKRILEMLKITTNIEYSIIEQENGADLIVLK